MHTFMLKIGSDEPKEYVSAFSQYSLAVMEAFGALGMPYPVDVEIWVPHMLPEHGPYKYRIADFVDAAGRQYVVPSIMSA